MCKVERNRFAADMFTKSTEKTTKPNTQVTIDKPGEIVPGKSATITTEDKISHNNTKKGIEAAKINFGAVVDQTIKTVKVIAEPLATLAGIVYLPTGVAISGGLITPAHIGSMFPKVINSQNAFGTIMGASFLTTAASAYIVNSDMYDKSIQNSKPTEANIKTAVKHGLNTGLVLSGVSWSLVKSTGMLGEVAKIAGRTSSVLVPLSLIGLGAIGVNELVKNSQQAKTGK